MWPSGSTATGASGLLNAEPAPAALPDEQALLTLLSAGELEVHARLTEASNATLYCTATLDGVATACVYKPTAGERPLWDFPTHTLSKREVAAYQLSRGSGLDVVPPTVLRDGPFGPGSVQWWISADDPDPVHPADEDADDPETGVGGFDLAPEPVMGELGAGVVDVCAPGQVPDGWMTVLEAEDRRGLPVLLAHADDLTLRRMALFDVVANNTDRKGGHILRHASGAIFGVDHGLTFNLDDKLRTVLWGWAGDPIGEEAQELLAAMVTDLRGDTGLRAGLEELLEPAEIDRTARRAAMLLRRGRFPKPPGGWPSIPWPPF
jgi:uncharacterized repeat protein (TIGR03843 family)